MKEIPKFLKAHTDEILKALQYADSKDLQAIRQFFTDAAKTTIEMELVSRVRDYKFDDKPWRLSGERCPRCRGQMIINRLGHECGELHCGYREMPGNITGAPFK